MTKPLPDGMVEMPRVKVDSAVAKAFRELSQSDGRPVTWHRRQAYEAYLATAAVPPSKRARRRAAARA